MGLAISKTVAEQSTVRREWEQAEATDGPGLSPTPSWLEIGASVRLFGM
jgi:hypothetical protein